MCVNSVFYAQYTQINSKQNIQIQLYTYETLHDQVSLRTAKIKHLKTVLM
jgi:hypothetical protein